MVKRLPILAFLLALPAFAQNAPPPTADQVREEANALISAVRQQRDAANDSLAIASAQIAKLTKELDAAKASKAEPRKDGKP